MPTFPRTDQTVETEQRQELRPPHSLSPYIINGAEVRVQLTAFAREEDPLEDSRIRQCCRYVDQARIGC